MTTEELQKIKGDAEESYYNELERKLCVYIADQALLGHSSCSFDDLDFRSWNHGGFYPVALYERFVEEYKDRLNITRRRFLGFALNAWIVRW